MPQVWTMDLLLHAIEDSTSMDMIYYLHTGEFIIKNYY